MSCFKISIITTTYRHEKFITQTIESVLAQTFTDWELLIGDDSPDNATWEIIQSYVQKYPDKIRAWHHNPNKGIVDNMNYLLGHVNPKSKYIAFLEGDDVFYTNNLQKKMEIIEQNKDVKLIYSDIDLINENGDIFESNFYKNKNIPLLINEKISSSLYIDSKQSLFVSWSNLLILKDVLTDCFIRNLNNQKNYGGSDYDFGFQVATHYNIFGITESLVAYRKHSSNISNDFHKMIGVSHNIIDFYFSSKNIDINTYKKKQNWLNTLSSLQFIIEQKKINAWDTYVKTFDKWYFFDLQYKIAILCFLLIPSSIGTRILKSLIHRNK